MKTMQYIWTGRPQRYLKNRLGNLPMKKFIPILLVVFTMFAWGANFHFTKIALLDYSSMGVATWRFFLGAVGLLGILLWRFGKRFLLVKFTVKEWWYVFLTAFFGVFLTIFFFNKGLETTSAVNGSLIIATSPAITALLSYLMEGKKLNNYQWAAILVSFFGVVLILVKGDFTRLSALQLEKGDLYILLMAVVFSLSQIIVAKFLPHVDAITMTAFSCFIALLLFAVFSLDELISVPVPPSLAFWSSILFMGLVGTSLAYTAFYYCVVKIGATTATLYMNLIPFFTVLLAYPFGEKLYLMQFFGGLAIIVGLLVFGLSNNK